MKKQFIAIGIAGMALVGLMIYFGINIGPAKIGFKTLPEDKVPRAIEAELMPEYREMERAFACRVDDKVYVVVTRGNKPTSGFEVAVNKLELTSENNKSKLTVFATFADPENPEKLAQVECFPYTVTETELTGLPDTIQLKVDYAK
ncbi:MAG: protease complex subunit PrcB family protein [Eubacteriaceae bacterium]|nr:protease complex subunit PrcB family protein [Eubacteriaceae bacterium]